MLTDAYGSAISVDAQPTAEAWDRLQHAFLSHGASLPRHLADTLDRSPDFALAHAVKGLMLLLLGRGELVVEARSALVRARAGSAETERERTYVRALADWLDGWPSRAATRLETLLVAHPRDALAMKLSHSIRFILGQPAQMAATLGRLAPTYAAEHPARGYFLGCRAFAFEETGDYRRAEALGRDALAVAGDDAWGLHAVAHVHDMTADARAGLAWLDAHAEAARHCNNFRYHVWWHRALMLIDTGATDAALALYDTEIRADRTDDFRDIANATSLLTRLEIEGVDVGSRWAELAELSEARIDDGSLLFADLHYLLALIGDGRASAADRLVSRIVRDGTRRQGDMSIRFATPGAAVAEGLAAFGMGTYRRAFDLLVSSRSGLLDAGGSHAQRDVFERLTVEAGLRAGRLDRTRAVLADRTARRGGKPDGFAERSLARIAALETVALRSTA